MRTAGARLDAYAHHPYPSNSRETPFANGSCKYCTTITMATLERLLSEVKRAFGPKRIWLTEYGYQTGAYGVTQQRQAELIGQSGMRVQKAPRVDMLIHYLVKDEPEAARFQSGLFQNSGRPKLAALAFPFPIAQAGRSGGNLVLWGQIRPRSGAQTYRVQVRTTGAWRFSGGVRRTSARGFFSTAVAAGARRPRADLLAAGRGVQHHDPRALRRPVAASFRADAGALQSFAAASASRLSWLVLRALPLRCRDRLLPRVGARSAAVGCAAPGARGAARPSAYGSANIVVACSCSHSSGASARTSGSGPSLNALPGRRRSSWSLLTRTGRRARSRRRASASGSSCSSSGIALLRRRLGLLPRCGAGRRAARLADARARPALGVRIGVVRTLLEVERRRRRARSRRHGRDRHGRVRAR